MTQTPAITLEWVREEKAKLKARLSDLEATERVLASAIPSQGGQDRRSPMGALMLVAHGTKKRVLLQVIADTADGLATHGVIVAGSHAGLKDLRTENVSPQLSGARADGLLDLKDGLWRITPKGREYLAAAKN